MRADGHWVRTWATAYDCGDHLHPSDRGYPQLGESIDLSLFD
jgi:hypothetical protein